MEVLDQEHSDQCCPNLSLKCIWTCADEGLDLQMLFEHLEKEFDFLSVPIYGADCGGSEAEVVGQKLDPPLILFIPYHYPSRFFWILVAGLGADKSNGLVKEYVPVLRYWMLLHDLEGGIVFQPGDEENAGLIPLPEEIKITVSTLNSDNATNRKRKITGGDNIRSFAIGDYREIRKIAIMVKK